MGIAGGEIVDTPREELRRSAAVGGAENGEKVGVGGREGKEVGALVGDVGGLVHALRRRRCRLVDDVQVRDISQYGQGRVFLILARRLPCGVDHVGPVRRSRVPLAGGHAGRLRRRARADKRTTQIIGVDPGEIGFRHDDACPGRIPVIKAKLIAHVGRQSCLGRLYKVVIRVRADPLHTRWGSVLVKLTQHTVIGTFVMEVGGE